MSKKRYAPKRKVEYHNDSTLFKVQGIVMETTDSIAHTDNMVGKWLFLGMMNEYNDGMEYLRTMGFQFANKSLPSLKGVKWGDEVEITFTIYSMPMYSYMGNKYYRTVLQGVGCRIIRSNGGNDEWREYLWELYWEREGKDKHKPVYPKGHEKTDREKRINSIQKMYQNAKRTK